MDLGNWDDEDDDFGVTNGAAASSSAANDVDDLIQFADSLTIQAEQPLGDDPAFDFDNDIPSEADKNLPPLPDGVRDLTRKRGVLLELKGNTKSSSDSTEEKEKPSQTCPFVEFHYDGFLQSSGERFDSSRDQNYPMIVQLDIPPSGKSSLIAGLELALRELSPGDKATISITSDFAYGDKGADDIPPGSDLKFDVEIIDVRATHKRVEVVDHSQKDLSRLEDIKREREIAQQRREEEAKAKDEEKKQKPDRAAALREKLANKNKGKKGGKKKKK